jgi:methylated-DNA-protein-cysteine methyltransferase-like protein
MKAQAPVTAWVTAVEAVVRSIPRGQTLSYAQVAMFAGKPGASRAVVRALYAIDGAPWWRVIKSDGTVAKEMFSRQAPRLKRDGLTLKGRRVARTSPSSPSRATQRRAARQARRG